MHLLLDTHAFLWFIQNDSQLSTAGRDLIEDTDSERYVSVTSCWEMAIKHEIGKLTWAEPFNGLIARENKTNAFRLLDIAYKHAERTISLDLHHTDPFDRLLIAQALVEGMPLSSNETLFHKYSGLDRRW